MPKRVKKEKRPVAKIDFKPYGAERGKQYAEWDAQRRVAASRRSNPQAMNAGQKLKT